MAREALISSYEDLAALRVQFEEFRSGHEKRTRLPEDLWLAAAEIGRRRGMNLVCRFLRLDANSLKKWMGQDSRPTKAKRKARKHNAEAPAHFVELFTPAASGGSSCMVEVDSPSGGKLRLEWRGVSASEVTQLIRTFAGH
jgi:hypothetical protein